MKAIQFIKQRVWLLAIFIFVLAFGLRLTAALKLAWRPDEIVYVDWIGAWFAKYFWLYFFQLKHHIYPPTSPVFGNPPLAMWLMSFGIWLAQKFHFSTLLGARLINCFIGSVSAFLLFSIGKNWFNLRTGILAGLALALLPLAITNNATAYLESLLVLLVIVQIGLIFSYFKTKENEYLYLLGVVLGLSILVKLTIFIFVISLLILILIVSYKNLKKSKFWLSYLLLVIIIIGTPLILWSGFRDVNHLREMYSLYANKTYSPFILNYPFPILQYYYLMIIGVLAPVLILGLLFKIITFFRDLIKNGLEKNKNLFLIVALLLIYLAYNGLATSYGASYQLLPIIPVVCLIAALGFDQIISYFRHRFTRGLITFGIVICLVLPLTAFKPAFWGLYASIFVGGTNNAFKLYPVGTEGEIVPLVANYINSNSEKDSRTAIMAYDWTLAKYLQDNRSVTSLFTTEGEIAGLARAADYLVLPRIFSQGNIGLTARELLREEPVEIIRVKGIELARIYKADYSKIQLKKTIEIGSKGDWQMKAVNNNPSLEINNNQLKIDYSFTKFFQENDNEDNRVLLVNNHSFALSRDLTGIYLEVLGDGNDKLCSVLLQGEDKNYLAADFVCDWHGWKKIYIPLAMFSPSAPNVKVNSEQNYTFDFGLISRKPMAGQVTIRNINLAILPD